MLIAGYIRFARAWKASPKSPLFEQPITQAIFLELATNAAYRSGRAGTIGCVETSIRKLSRDLRYARNTVAYNVQKLINLGLVRVIQKRPNFCLEVIGYEYLHDLDKWLDYFSMHKKILAFAGESVPVAKSAVPLTKIDDWTRNHDKKNCNPPESQEKKFAFELIGTPPQKYGHDENLEHFDTIEELIENETKLGRGDAFFKNVLNTNYINITNNNIADHKVITSSDTSIPESVSIPVAVELQKVTSIDDIDPSISLCETKQSEVLIPTSISNERTEGNTASRDEALQDFLPKTDIDVVQSHAEANLMRRKLEIETMLKANKPLDTNSTNFGKQLSDEERAKLRSEKQTIEIGLADALKIEQKQPYNAPEISPASLDTPKALENDLRLHAPIPYLEVEVPLVSDKQVSSFVESLTKRFLELRTERHRQERERVYRIDPTRMVMPLDHSPEEVQRFKSIFHELEKDLTHRDLLDLIEFTYSRAGVRDHFDPQMFVNRVYGIPQAVEWLQDLRKNKR